MPQLKTSLDANRLTASIYYKNPKGKNVEFILPNFRMEKLFSIRDFIEEYTKQCVLEATQDLQQKINELKCKEFPIDD